MKRFSQIKKIQKIFIQKKIHTDKNDSKRVLIKRKKLTQIKKNSHEKRDSRRCSQMKIK